MSSARPANSGSGARRTVKSRSKSPSASKSGEGGSLGLRKLVQKRILDDVFQAATDKCPGWKVLIIDELGMRVISSAVGMYDIMERRVTLVESLEKKRAPFPDMGAIYFLEPCEKSINLMLQDFTSSKVLYGTNVFLYFLGGLDDVFLDKIKVCKPLMKRLKALVEVNIDFLAKEERAFLFDMRDSFGPFFLRRGATPMERKVVDRLVTVCATLNEYPHIRFRQSSTTCQGLATMFHRKMDEFVSNNPRWWYHGGPEKGQQTAKKDRSTLLLLDRSDDFLSPLMHDFTYQSMVHDLLKMDGDRITTESENAEDADKTDSKDILLDEKDNLWVELRGKHIAAVIETLSNRIRDIMSSSTGNNLSKGKGQMSLSEMASALKALPEYREVMSKLSQHMHIAHKCMDVLKRDNLMELAELEQTLATGKDEEGQSPKAADLLDQAEKMIMGMKDTNDRFRLILIMTFSQGGLKAPDRRRLINAAELPRKDIQALNALESLGLLPSATTEKKGVGGLFASILGRGSASTNSDEESEYAACRYVPMMKFILDDLVNESLSFDDYPSVLPMPEQTAAQAANAAKKGAGGARGSKRGEAASARKASGATSRWSKSSADSSGSQTAGPALVGGRNIVFMVGGLAYSELRVAREIMAASSREIIMGSTTFVSPKQFMEDLQTLSGSDGQPQQPEVN